MEELNEGAATVEASRDASGALLVTLHGELDMASIPGVEAQIEAFIEDWPHRVVFDMAAVTFMDSSGIAMLLRAAGRVKSISVRNPTQVVRRIIECTGLANMLLIEP